MNQKAKAFKKHLFCCVDYKSKNFIRWQRKKQLIKKMDKPKNLLAALMALLPALVIVYMIQQYGVNVPFMDEWDTPGIAIVKYKEGSLTLEDLLAQHGECRFFFPRLMMIAIAITGGWNTRIAMGITLFLAFLISLNILLLIKLTLNLDLRKRLLIYFLANLFIFSPLQYQNWLWSIQIVKFIPVLCITGSLVAIYADTKLITKFAYFTFLSTIAMYSNADGILCWIIVFPVLVINTWDMRRGLLWKLLMTCAFAVSVFGTVLYFYDYSKPSIHPDYIEALEHPIRTIIFYAYFLGSPLGFKDKGSSLAIGVLVLSLFFNICMYISVLVRRKELIKPFLPWLAITIYSLLNGVLTTMGRVGFGAQQALTSRYVTYATYASVGLIFLYNIWLTRDSSFTIFGRIKFRQRQKYKTFLFAILTIILIINWNIGLRRMARAHNTRLFSRTCLSFINVLNEEECIVKALHPNPQHVRKLANNLHKEGVLNINLIKSNRLEDFTSFMDKNSGTHGILDSLVKSSDGSLTARGWAILREHQGPADAVILSYENFDGFDIAFAISPVERKRRDVADALQSEDYLRSGWEKQIRKDKLPPDIEKISAWAFDTRRLQAFKLSGDILIPYSLKNNPSMPLLLLNN